MGSIIRGFEYDIFVSYRHKDNKYDGWVTDFIEDLKGELAATLKDDISVYFDSNPVDGLLESHQVDKSLSEKLRSCILIPVLSRTYCDPRSFAWNYEFLNFNRMAKKDPYGREIKLSSGNISSRILPVRIHELEAEDYRLLEESLETQVRAIDFIYQSPGVNRPLRRRDDDLIREESQLIYRDQINKLALSIKEILYGMRSHDPTEDFVQANTAESAHLTRESSLGFRTKILKHVSLFNRMEEKELEKIAEKLVMLNIEPDSLIIKKGEPGQSMYVIVDGKVKVHDEEHIFSYMAGGDYFGEYTLIDEAERSASVTSLESTTLFKLEKDVFQDISLANPQFLHSMLKTMIERLRKLDITQEKLATSHSEVLEKKEDMERQNQELENLNEIKRQTMRMVADDLQNPLTSSLSITDLLKDELKEKEPDLLEHLEAISRSLRRMNDITVKLLDIHKIENQS